MLELSSWKDARVTYASSTNLHAKWKLDPHKGEKPQSWVSVLFIRSNFFLYLFQVTGNTWKPFT